MTHKWSYNIRQSDAVAAVNPKKADFTTTEANENEHSLNGLII